MSGIYKFYLNNFDIKLTLIKYQKYNLSQTQIERVLIESEQGLIYFKISKFRFTIEVKNIKAQS